MLQVVNLTPKYHVDQIELRTPSRRLALPCVGIGGITLDNAKPILEAGACGVAIISAIAHADNPYEAVQQFKHLVDSTK